MNTESKNANEQIEFNLDTLSFKRNDSSPKIDVKPLKLRESMFNFGKIQASKSQDRVVENSLEEDLQVSNSKSNKASNSAQTSNSVMTPRVSDKISSTFKRSAKKYKLSAKSLTSRNGSLLNTDVFEDIDSMLQ